MGHHQESSDNIPGNPPVLGQPKPNYNLVGSALKTLIGDDGRLLFVHCQTGKLIEYVQVSRVTAVNISTKMIDLTRQKHPKSGFDGMDLEKELPEGSFDTVLIQGTEMVNSQAMLERLPAAHAHHLLPRSSAGAVGKPRGVVVLIS